MRYTQYMKLCLHLSGSNQNQISFGSEKFSIWKPGLSEKWWKMLNMKRRSQWKLKITNMIQLHMVEWLFICMQGCDLGKHWREPSPLKLSGISFLHKNQDSLVTQEKNCRTLCFPPKDLDFPMLPRAKVRIQHC